jgi:RimJ/RimL family protein N-acetyltransferase
MGTIEPQTYRVKTGEDILIRVPQPEDAPHLLTLTASIIQEGEYSITEIDEFTHTVESEIEWIRRHADEAGSIILVAENKGKIVGMLNFAQSQHHRLSHSGDLGIEVIQGWRECGVGTLLLQTLLDWARNHPQIKKVRLGVLSSNERAIHVYRKLGFVDEGLFPRAVQIAPGEFVDELRMYQFV